ncbi:MAG TPA: FAD:protein FMN transferase [Candidatus Paceibacterota bacterium]|jgi:thiamine biosynthesis lipoprotein|nr:FAD:protein FMN transferase [Candidatus Paceibacterota bacterium]
MAQFNFKAIGTVWRIDVYDLIEPEQERAVSKAILERITAFDLVYSRFRSDSTVAQIARASGVYELPLDADLLFTTYHDLYTKTDGYFTPLIGQMLVDAGYDPAYSLEQKKELQRPPTWDEAIEFRNSKDSSNGKPALIVKKPVQLDFGAAGKGYIIDLVGKVLDGHGIRSYLINAGGDILRTGDDVARIGLEDPMDTTKAIGIYTLKNGSICGSSGNRRAWGTFTHIMNPKTLESATKIAAVWVAAPTALIADALTTCLFFVPPETLFSLYHFEYCIMYKDRTFIQSDGFGAELFLN